MERRGVSGRRSVTSEPLKNGIPISPGRKVSITPVQSVPGLAADLLDGFKKTAVHAAEVGPTPVQDIAN